jgi:hypothetical protein
VITSTFLDRKPIEGGDMWQLCTSFFMIFKDTYLHRVAPIYFLLKILFGSYTVSICRHSYDYSAFPGMIDLITLKFVLF